jgi:hypothetical protein
MSELNNVLYAAEYGPLNALRADYDRISDQLGQHSDTAVLRYLELLVVRKQTDLVQRLYATIRTTHPHLTDNQLMDVICRGLYGFCYNDDNTVEDLELVDVQTQTNWKPLLDWLNSLAPQTHQYEMHLYPHGWFHAIKVGH